MPALSTEAPPFIPDGPVTYDSVSYDSYYDDAFSEPAAPVYAPAVAPVTPSSTSSVPRGIININAWTSNYQVRGMGVRDVLSEHGYSSIDASITLPNRNLFGRGIYHRVRGGYGEIWGGCSPLGSSALWNFGYSMGKEVFPNLTAELGYTFRHGGLEGYMGRFYDGASHRFTQDLNLTITFDDNQRGFFGHVVAGYAFQGLNGGYFDLEAGYRFTDIVTTGRMGADLKVALGVSPSLGYWDGDADGVDAIRLRATLQPYTHGGFLGRDGRLRIEPWLQFSWAGDNASVINRKVGYEAIDSFQMTIGVDASWRF